MHVYERAIAAVGRLDGVTTILPSTPLLLYMYVRKEVPPPPNRLDECLDTLERFLHSKDAAVSPLIRAGLADVQFETIHPFLDGNGRLGRLLITLILCEAGILREPILYLSLFLKSRRDDYYRLLQEVRRGGTWETWMEFFLKRCYPEKLSTDFRGPELGGLLPQMLPHSGLIPRDGRRSPLTH